jgi:O-antigen/teichoic acid export membrane protein
MAFGGYGPWALVAQQLGAAATGTIFLWIVSKYRPRLRFSRAHLRDLFSVSSSISVTTLLWFISSRIDQIIISRYAGVSSVGIYVVGNKLPEMARVITHEPLANISLPALARLQHDFSQMRETTYEGMELNATVSFALFIGIAITAGDIVPLIFGAQWAGAGQIGSVLSILALVNVLSVFFHPLLLASGCAGRYALLSVLSACGTVVACLIGIRFSVFHLVVGLLVNNLVNLIPCLILLRRKIGLSAFKYYSPCVMPACAAITMVAATRLVTLLPAETPRATILTCKVLIGAAAYGGFLLVFKKSSIDKLIAGIRRALEP